MQDNKLYLALEADMDAVVFTEGRGIWRVVASPSMRGLGDMMTAEDRTILIEPDEGSDLQGVDCGPHATLEEAMAAIGAHLSGRCIYAPKRGRW